MRRVDFSIPVTPHTFRHSYIMHMLYHRQPRKIIQPLAGHKDPCSMGCIPACLRWTWLPRWPGDGRDAAEILRALPSLK